MFLLELACSDCSLGRGDPFDFGQLATGCEEASFAFSIRR